LNGKSIGISILNVSFEEKLKCEFNDIYPERGKSFEERLEIQQRFFGASPYGICFVSKETYGSASLGVFDYELKFYPSLFDTDMFFDDALFAGEFIRGGVKRVLEKCQRDRLCNI
jgi:hypothetical protein